ncbi:hypothetical protein TNCV_4385151 [Trichonephila clavipes]|nr:hypothetical protein TNCV_4385151 [Trichonephila clavipes]
MSPTQARTFSEYGVWIVVICAESAVRNLRTGGSRVGHPCFTPLVKDYKHSQRLESAQLENTITGPEQIRSSDFAKN